MSDHPAPTANPQNLRFERFDPAPTAAGSRVRGNGATVLSLACGVVAGPLFFAASLLQASLRDGFDPARDTAGALALGSAGWIQQANFVLCGLLTIAAAAGLRRLFRGATTGPVLIALAGVALMALAAFTTDPPGTTSGTSAEGAVNLAMGAVAAIALGLAFLALAPWFAASGRPAIARGSRICAVLCIVLFTGVTNGALLSPWGTIGWLASWGWLAVLCAAGLAVVRAESSRLHVRA